MALNGKLVWISACVFVIVAVCVLEADCRRGSARSSSRYGRTSRVGRTFRRSYSKPSGTIRKSSGIFNSNTFKVALTAGIIYGGARYMRSSYYHRYPERVPPICTNNYDTASNGLVYGHFICPRENEPDNYTWCCGPQKQEFCCDEYYYGKPSRGSSSSSPFAIIGAVVVIIVVVAVVLICCKRFRSRGGSGGTIFSRFASKKSHRTELADPQLAVPLKPREPHPPPVHDTGFHHHPPPMAYGDMKGGFPASNGPFPSPAGPYPPPAAPYPLPDGTPYPPSDVTPYPLQPPSPYPPPTGPYPPPDGAPYPPSTGPYPPPNGPYPPSDGPYPPSDASSYPHPDATPYPPSVNPYPSQAPSSYPQPSPADDAMPMLPCAPSAPTVPPGVPPPPYPTGPDATQGYGQGSAYTTQPSCPPYPPQ